MKPLQNYCVLLFDEMSFQAGLQYRKKGDYIDGFTDLGGADRHNNFADHALVFMVRGVYRKWKDTVAYYLTDSTLSSRKLAAIIEQVIRKVQSTGLKVVATVCDQAQKNKAAIGHLKRESDAQFLRNEREIRHKGL